MESHLKPDKVATATEKAFITGCCESIEDISDTVAQTSVAAEVPIFSELVEEMVKHPKELAPLPLQEGGKV